MASKVIQQEHGLWLEPQGLSAPPGSLRQCDDVLLHRPGMIGPRFGIGVATEIATRSTTYRPVKMIPWSQELVISSHLPATGYRLERGTVDTQYVTGAGGAPPATGYEVDAFQARGSLYLALDTAIRKLTSASASIANAGLDVYNTFPRVTQVAVGAGADKYAIDDTAAVAYRVVWVSEDANGYIRRSAPGERYVASNPDANRKVVRFDRIYLPTWGAAGDILEIYRTVNVSPQSATPSTEYQLAITHTVTSAEASAGYIAEDTIEDDTLDANLGAFLYTNPSQGGILGANEPPPKANVCAWWNGFAWYANTVDRHRLELEIAAVYTTDAEFDVVGMHAGTFTGDYTSGSAIISNVNRVDGMMVGQYVTDSTLGPTQAGTRIPAETQLTKVQTRVQIVNASISDGDTFTLFGVTFTMRAAPSGNFEVLIGASDSATAINVVAKINDLPLTSWLYPVDPLAVHAGSGLITIEESTAGHGVEFATSDAAAFQFDITAGATTFYRLTMDANASATAAGVTSFDSDWISVNGTTFYVFPSGAELRSTSGAAATANPTYRLIANETTVGEQARSFARAMSAYTRLTSATFATWGYRDIAQWNAAERSDGWFLLRRALGTNTAITVQALRGASLRPNAASTVESESGVFANRLYWSRLDEPEAVPLLNFADAGPKNFAIRKLVALEDALLVWTDRGLYRVTGVGGVWRIDPVSTDLRLLHGECVTQVRDVCYAWTDRGVVSVTGQGAIEIVSGPIGVALRDTQRHLPEGATAADNRGFYMWGHARLGLVGLALASGTEQTVSALWYVLHQGPGAWARWVRDDRCAVYSSGKDALRTGSGLAHWSIRGERVLLETPGIETSVQDKVTDINLSVTITAGTGTSITIAQSDFTPYTPVVGDVITRSSIYARVEAVATSGANYILTISTALGSTGAATWFQGFTSTLLWNPQTVGSPGLEGHWQEMQLHLQAHASLVSSFPITAGGQVHLGTTPSTVTPTVTTGSQITRPVRLGLPREVARSPHFIPYVQIKTAGVYWQLGPVVLEHRVVGRMVAR